jgi:hypothetical protein
VTPAELVGQIRFALGELTTRNAAHDFEEACRQFARLRIATNILPATGPVGALGDQGRDFETFRSYLAEELGRHGAFLALVSDGPVVFACTIKAEGLEAKVLEDVTKITSQGTPVARVYFFSVGPIAVGIRHRLQEEAAQKFEVELEIIDGAALAEQLAERDLFWIAEQYLRLPAEYAPDRGLEDLDVAGPPTWYLTDRARWRERGHALPTIGYLLDLRDGLRYATRHLDARGDLPFWLGLMSELVGEGPNEVRRRARYEVAVAQIKGTGDLAPADEHVTRFIEESLDTDDVSRLTDSSILLAFATTAFGARRTGIDGATLSRWSRGLQARVASLLGEDPPPTAKAALLELEGNLRFAIDPSRVVPADEPVDLPEISDLVDDDGRPLGTAKVDPAAAEAVMVDAEAGMRSWLALAELLPEAPLFPLDRLSRMLEILAPLLVEQPGWRALTEGVDAGVERVAGAAAAAERSYGRARTLLGAERVVDAISEIHQAKVSWWSGDTLRQSLLMLVLLSRCYAELRMAVAAKQYALAAAAVAANSGDDELVDIIPRALSVAAHLEYDAGAWCSAVNLAAVAELASQLTDEATDAWAGSNAQAIFFTFGMTILASRSLFGKQADLTAAVERAADGVGLLEPFEETMGDQDEWTPSEWLERSAEQLHALPFEDIGEERLLRFAALGVKVLISCNNRWSDVLAAERLAAALQVLMVELSDFDLCLLPTTIEIAVVAEASARAPTVENLSTNEGRRWKVTLRAYAPGDTMGVEDVSLALLTVVSQVLLDVSLLPAEEFLNGIETAFARGLPHKLTAGRPYDEVASVVDHERFEQIPRRTESRLDSRWEPMPEAVEALSWQDGPGPTVGPDELVEMIANRYEQIPDLMRRTLPRLRQDRRFQTTIRLLRGKGWKDWHILTAIYNVLLQRRLGHAGLNVGETIATRAGQEAVRELAFTPEADDEPEVPLEIFLNVEQLDDARILAMASLVHNLGLETHSPIPDLPATERLLGARYGYWTDDVDHEDPFRAVEPLDGEK